jgi:hypothetical protein
MKTEYWGIRLLGYSDVTVLNIQIFAKISQNDKEYQ